MSKEIISNLLNNKLLSLTLSEKDQNIFRKYLNALKLNNSLLILSLQDIGNDNIQALLNILIHNNSIQQLYFSNCDFDGLYFILYYFKLNYYISIHLSILVSFNLLNMDKLSILLYYNSNNIIELFCIINDEDCILKNNIINSSSIEILDNSIYFMSNYKILLISSYSKPLIETLIKNKLLIMHLNFIKLYYNKNLIHLLQNIIQYKYNLSDNIMKRIDITNNLKFNKPIKIKLFK